jgi:hypothetical protein
MQQEVRDILVRIGRKWYTLETIYGFDKTSCSMPILVLDEEGQDYEYDYTDIDEFEG